MQMPLYNNFQAAYEGCLKSNLRYLRKGIKNRAKNFEKIYLKCDFVDYFST